MFKYDKIKAVAALVLVTIFFSITWIGNSQKHVVIAQSIARMSFRTHGMPDFNCHAIADGTSDILKRGRRWRDYNPTETRKKNDASLFDFFGLNRMTPSTNRDIPDKKSKYVFTLLSIDFHLRRSENHHSTLYLQGRGHF